MSIRHHLLIPFCLWAVALTAQAGPLGDSWGALVTNAIPPVTRIILEEPKAKRPTPKAKKKVLGSRWSRLIKRYPYPKKRMNRSRLSRGDLKHIPRFYQRRHRYHSGGVETWRRLLAPYRNDIREASRRFRVPEAIIAAVIMQESGGNSRAKAKGTSAKGLMQTIDGTFEMARKNLAKDEIRIRNPLVARDSIYAGSWYLAHCLELARADRPGRYDRSDPLHWERALEYYYAGPQWGRDPRAIVHIYRKGKRVRIHKGRYSEGVLTYARRMEAGGIIGRG